MNCFGNDKCEIKCNDRLGRFVVASRDLKAGELLLCEAPAVIGPYWESKLCCLNCFDESMRMCNKCKIAPLCFRCDTHDVHECDFLATSKLPRNFLLDHFDLLTPLRCLILSRDASRRELFDALCQMESHCEHRRDTPVWCLHQRKVVEPLQSLNGFLLETETADWLQKMCGILDVNSFEVRTPNFEEIPVRGLYPRAALLPHDCVSNTFLTVDGAKMLRIYTSVDIRRGEIVYNNYTSTLFGTFMRQTHLREGKYFVCSCPRCLDPTELQTHLSSVICKLCQGKIQFQNDQWLCGKCSAIYSTEKIQQIEGMARMDVCSIDTNIEQLEYFIEKYSKELNPNHYLVLEMKQKLAAVLRHVCDESGPNRVMSKKEQKYLRRKVELCEELLPVLRVLKPGISRLTAIALFENFTALFRLAQIQLSSGTIDRQQYLEELVTAERCAKESVAMLIYEPPSTPEGNLSRHAMQQLRQIRKLIERHQTKAAKTAANCSRKSNAS